MAAITRICLVVTAVVALAVGVLGGSCANFNTVNGYDFPNFDIRSFSTSAVSDCYAACDADVNCGGVVLHDNTCWLKTAAAFTVANENIRAGSIVGRCGGIGLGHCPASYQLLTGVDYPNSDITSFACTSMDVCMKTCDMVPSCQGAVMHDGTCWLKTAAAFVASNQRSFGGASVGICNTAPSLPLHSNSRWILDANNHRVKLRCVNWAGHMEVNLPEGLNKQPVSYLAAWIKAQGFNCVRLTYSIDHALNPFVTAADSFTNAAAAANVSPQSMADAWTAALARNPFLAHATQRDVYATIIDQLWSNGVMTILDNHVSKASWCCNMDDGNGWWDTASGYISANSRYFHTGDWLAGLKAMAEFTRAHPGVVGMSLRNELREWPILNSKNDWYTLVSQAATLVHQTNPDLLVVIGGTLSATDMTQCKLGPLDTSAWAGKNVWEWHAYSFTVTYKLGTTCSTLQQQWGWFDGFLLSQGQSYTGPLFLSEFGVGMTGGPNNGLSDGDNSYLQCLVQYISGNDMEWAVWALQGSYYVREGTVDYDEGFGVLNHDWSGWRNPQFPPMLAQAWQLTQTP